MDYQFRSTPKERYIIKPSLIPKALKSYLELHNNYELHTEECEKLWQHVESVVKNNSILLDECHKRNFHFDTITLFNIIDTNKLSDEYFISLTEVGGFAIWIVQIEQYKNLIYQYNIFTGTGHIIYWELPHDDVKGKSPENISVEEALKLRGLSNNE